MPTVCDLIKHFYGIALDFVAPENGQPALMPELISDEEVEENKGLMRDRMDAWYSGTDEGKDENRLQRLFRDEIFERILKNPKKADLANDFIEDLDL